MANRFEPSDDGIKQLARSTDVERAILGVCRRIAEAAGEGHEASTWQGFDRVRGTVRTTTIAAARAEAEDRTLTRAVDAGRV